MSFLCLILEQMLVIDQIKQTTGLCYEVELSRKLIQTCRFLQHIFRDQAPAKKNIKMSSKDCIWLFDSVNKVQCYQQPTLSTNLMPTDFNPTQLFIKVQTII